MVLSLRTTSHNSVYYQVQNTSSKTQKRSSGKVGEAVPLALDGGDILVCQGISVKPRPLRRSCVAEGRRPAFLRSWQQYGTGRGGLPVARGSAAAFPVTADVQL